MVHVPSTKGADDATPVKLSKQRTMIRAAARSRVMKVKMVWIRSLKRNLADIGCSNGYMIIMSKELIINVLSIIERNFVWVKR